MTSSTWIIDFESYQIDSDFYPLEICILNVCTGKSFLFFVKYPYNYLNSNETLETLRYQYRRHRLHWDDGDQCIHSTVIKLKKIIANYSVSNIKIYVKGEQKHKLVSHWFAAPSSTNTFNVIDIGANAPRFTALKHLCASAACAKHAHNLELFCARRKCYQLLPFIKFAEIVTTTHSSEDKITNNINSETDNVSSQTDVPHETCGDEQIKTNIGRKTLTQRIFAYMHMLYIIIRNRLHA